VHLERGCAGPKIEPVTVRVVVTAGLGVAAVSIEKTLLCFTSLSSSVLILVFLSKLISSPWPSLLATTDSATSSSS